MANMLTGRVRLGAFELDLKSGELYSLEAPTAKAILLREQVLQVLLLLVECGGKIVTREEIQSKLWANDTVVVNWAAEPLTWIRSMQAAGRASE